jgi:hypothetical protein
MASSRIIQSPADWRGPEIAQSDDWKYCLSTDQRAEVERALDHLADLDRPFIETTKDDFPLPTVGPVLRDLLEDCEAGRGFLLLRNLPVQNRSEAHVQTLFWGLGLHLGVVVPQSDEAELIGDVRDRGDDSAITGRGYRSKDAINFHVDLSDLVLLLCRRTAMIGGKSRLASSLAVHNELARRRPDLLDVLYEPMTFKKLGWDPSVEKPWFRQPVFALRDGHFASRFASGHITDAVKLDGVPPLTPIQSEAIEVLHDIACDPAIYLDMEFEDGDMQFVINRLIYHSRTGFTDHPDPDRKRHVLRMWVATPSGRPLPESWREPYGSIEPASLRGGVQAWMFRDKFGAYQRRAADSLGMKA